MENDGSLIDYYARRATEYERIYQKPERQPDLRALRELVGDILAGSDLLELACGTGYWTDVLARTAKSIVAADLSEEVLEVARAKKMGPHVSFRTADAYALPAFWQHFTAGFAGFWWSHIPKASIPGFLAGFHRALSPGAKVVFIDNVYVEGSSTPISRRDDHGDTYQIRRLQDGSAHEVRKNFPTDSELRAAVARAGSEVRIEFLRYYWCLSYIVQT